MYIQLLLHQNPLESCGSISVLDINECINNIPSKSVHIAEYDCIH